MKLQKLRPILWTKNLPETIDFYVNILGFACRARLADWAALKKDDIEIMASFPHEPPEDCKGPGDTEEFFKKPQFTGAVYIDIDSVDELWENVKDKVKVNYGVENMEWGMREFSIYDNNGYELVFGQEIK